MWDIPGYDCKVIMLLKWCVHCVRGDILLQGLAAAILWDVSIYYHYCRAKQCGSFYTSFNEVRVSSSFLMGANLLIFILPGHYI